MNTNTIFYVSICLCIFLGSYCSGNKSGSSIQIVSASASSTLKDSRNLYQAVNLNDGTQKTWCEGKADYGKGVVITLKYGNWVHGQNEICRYKKFW